MRSLPHSPLADIGKAASKSFLAGALFFLGSVVAEVLWKEGSEYFENLKLERDRAQTTKTPRK